MVTKLKGAENAEVVAICVRFAIDARETTTLSLKDFGKRVGMTPEKISSVENATRHYAPKLEILAQIAFGAGGTFKIKKDDQVVFQIERTKARSHLVNQLFSETKKLTIRSREETGLSQKDFANSRGLHRSIVSGYENKGRNLAQNSPVTLETIVKILGCPAASISLGFGD